MQNDKSGGKNPKGRIINRKNGYKINYLPPINIYSGSSELSKNVICEKRVMFFCIFDLNFVRPTF